MDDFVRNFLVRAGMTSTLEKFETEWYELEATGKLNKDALGPVPDLYNSNQDLNDRLARMRHDLEQARDVAERASGTWDKFRKERDFHRLHHKRIVQEKNKLLADIKRLRKHYAQYEPTIVELKRKYELAMKSKMLTQLESDKMSPKVREFQSAEQKKESAAASKEKKRLAEEARAEKAKKDAMRSATAVAEEKAVRASMSMTSTAKNGDAVMKTTLRENPFANVEFDPVSVEHFALEKTFKGHMMSVSNLALHPKKSIVATASDDATWKMWDLPSGDLIMSGDGHKDWVSGVGFNPAGTHLVSTSGDCTVKIWDFKQKRCTVTFAEHGQAVWNACFHDSGDFVASCSLDHSARLWDLQSNRCRMAFRGHVDSVNEVCWQPFTNCLATGSSDKTVSTWDARNGRCAQTFYGHLNSCNHLSFNTKGDKLASCDADGVVKLWDVRMVAELLTVDCGPHPANKVVFDRAGAKKNTPAMFK